MKYSEKLSNVIGFSLIIILSKGSYAICHNSKFLENFLSFFIIEGASRSNAIMYVVIKITRLKRVNYISRNET